MGTYPVFRLNVPVLFIPFSGCVRFDAVIRIEGFVILWHEFALRNIWTTDLSSILFSMIWTYWFHVHFFTRKWILPVFNIFFCWKFAHFCAYYLNRQQRYIVKQKTVVGCFCIFIDIAHNASVQCLVYVARTTPKNCFPHCGGKLTNVLTTYSVHLIKVDILEEQQFSRKC